MQRTDTNTCAKHNETIVQRSEGAMWGLLTLDIVIPIRQGRETETVVGEQRILTTILILNVISCFSKKLKITNSSKTQVRGNQPII